MNRLAKAAKYYTQKLGWSVIPLSPNSKIPPKGFDPKPYRERIASTDEINSWWSENPDYNIGIITGRLSNLFVVDHDRYKEDYSDDQISLLIPDSIITCCAETPKDGLHQYFRFNDSGLTIKAGFLPSIDYRGEGGYIVAPPSKNGNGKEWKWIKDLSPIDVPVADIPDAFLNASSNKYKSTLYTKEVTSLLQTVTPVTSSYIWSDGQRDENLYHVAHCLAKTKNDAEYIRQTLRAIMFSWGESDEKWIDAKIQSVVSRAERKERNIQAEVDSFISVTSGYFSVTDCYSLLQSVTKEERTAIRIALMRRKDKTIEKVGQKDGVYRRIDTDIEHIDFNEDEGASFPVKLPLNLHDLVDICEGNIILASGEFNAGKTTFALNCLALNKSKIPIRYISSEMRAGEFKARWKAFGVPQEFWMPDDMTEYVALKNNLPSLIKPDAINIIDYLEFRDGDYTQGAEYMRQIHDKLKTGIAIVCNQHKEGAKLPRAGDLIMEKPRLAITFRKINSGNDENLGYVEIQKAKNVKLGKADGKKLKFKIVDKGSRFKTLINWGWWK